MKRIICLLCVIVALAGCGRKGPLIPPEALVPAAVTDLRAAQQGERFLLSWSPPTKELGGRKLAEPVGYGLYRRDLAPEEADCAACSDGFRLVGEIPVGYQPRLRAYDGRLFFDDTDVAAGRSYLYQLVAHKADRVASPPSNRVRRTLLPAPPAPLLQITPTAVAAELFWLPVTVPSGTTLVGYNVYRCRTGETMPPRPLTAAPLTTERYEDLRLERGVTYRYALRTVVRVNNETLESPLSREVSAALVERE